MPESTWDLMSPAQQAACADAGRGPYAFAEDVEKEEQDEAGVEVDVEDDDLEDFLDEEDEEVDEEDDEDDAR